MNRILLFLFLGCLGWWVFQSETLLHTDNQVPRMLFILDTSFSFSAEDIEGDVGMMHSRLNASQDFLHRFTWDHIQFWLATFADATRLQLPFSNDKNLSDATIDAITTIRYPAVTDIPTALLFAKTLYKDIPMTLVLITDGEETRNIDSNTGITLDDEHRLVIVGVGTEHGAKLVNYYDGNGQRVFKRYNGEEVVSHLDKKHLWGLANTHNSPIFFIEKMSDIDMVYNQILSLDHGINLGKNYIFGVAIVFFIVCILAFPVWREKKYIQ